MIEKHEIINKIIADTESNSYLEIGYGDGFNYNQIKCLSKFACDPETVEMEVKDDEGNVIKTFKPTSDEFFDTVTNDFDVIFIDGLHHADQVRKDISNALKCNPKAIILHDTLPPTESHQIVPRAQKQWTGNCWRAVVGFIESYPDVRVETYRSDFGLTVIYPEGKKTRKHFENMDLKYEEFKKKEVELLKIID